MGKSLYELGIRKFKPSAYLKILKNRAEKNPTVKNVTHFLMKADAEQKGLPSGFYDVDLEETQAKIKKEKETEDKILQKIIEDLELPNRYPDKVTFEGNPILKRLTK